MVLICRISFKKTEYYVRIKVKQSLYRPGQGFQGLEAPRFPEIWHVKVEGSKVANTMHRPPLTQDTFLILIFVTA
jgi:hypothetical protein